MAEDQKLDKNSENLHNYRLNKKYMDIWWKLVKHMRRSIGQF